jgi:putative membrane-bound dehydrogenase-like protein
MKNTILFFSSFSVLSSLLAWQYLSKDSPQLQYSLEKTYQSQNQAIKYHANPITDDNTLFCPDDMVISLWAESPMFYNPTNMDIDAKGRVWVTEAVDYRNFNSKPEERFSRKTGERVVILEDTDQDGKADKSSVFVEDTALVAPLGISVVGNKVYVAAAPSMFVYTDTDGDDKADKREIFLTGFGVKDHDHSLHSGVMAPDGKFFFNVGNAGPHKVTDKSGWTLRSGSVYTGGSPWSGENKGNQVSDDGRVWVGGMAFKIGKDGKGMKVMAHNFRNSYEVAMDSYGNMWQNDNDDQVIACRTSFTIENGSAGYFCLDGTRQWQADRRPGQDMFTASWHQEDPGMMPACDNTGAGSPTGFHVYEGDAFGDKYRGMLLSCEAGRNVIFNYFPKAKGAGFELERNDLVSSQGKQSSEKYDWYETGEDKRKWFRPSDACAGTDGSIFITDWYDPIVGGHAMRDKKGYGRIYRLTPKGKKLTTPKIDISTVEGQIEALKNPAQNVRYLGFEALLAGGTKSISAVKELLKSPNQFHRARAIWLMAQLGNEGKAEVTKLLQSDDESFRLVAFRALRELSTDVVPLCEIMANDPNPAIRREVGIALRDVNFEASKNAIMKLINKYDGQDAWLLNSLGTASDKKQVQVYEMAKKNGIAGQKLTNLAWELHPINALEDLKSVVISSDFSFKEKNKAITAIGFMKDKKAAETMLSFLKNSQKDVAESATWWVNYRKTNEWADLMDWEALSNEIISPNMKKMMALGAILEKEKTPLPEKIKIAQQMAKDKDGGQIILDLVSNYKIGGKELNAKIGEVIFDNPDSKVRLIASQYFPRNGAAPLKVDFIARMKGDDEKGKTTFATYCATCHRHGENGNEIGPDLTNIHKKFEKYDLLDAIVNPSASMVFGFESYSITTKKGKSYFGFLLGDDGKTITLKDAAGQTSAIKVADIVKKEKMPNSLMPEPTSIGLKEQELADLSAYLLSFK